MLLTFWLRNVLRATTPCTFLTSQLPKVLRDRQSLTLLTSKCASRHNGVHFFDISTSKSAPRPSVFNTFYFQMCFAPQRRALFNISTSKSALNPSVFNTFYFQICFAPQRRALFQHLNFQKWSDAEVFCTFSLQNQLRATTACNFSSLISPDVSAPAALAIQPSGATKPRKNTVFRDFPTFSRTCIFFLLIFSLLTLLPADCFFISPYCRKFDF